MVIRLKALEVLDRIEREELGFTTSRKEDKIVSYGSGDVKEIVSGVSSVGLLDGGTVLMAGVSGVSLVDDAIRGVQRFLDTLDQMEGVTEAIGVGDSDVDDPSKGEVGSKRAGWIIDYVTKYEFGRMKRVKVWKKAPSLEKAREYGGQYNRLNFGERCAYYFGMRVQAVTGRKARNRAYRRGFDDGVDAQRAAEQAHEGGVTPPQYYRVRRPRR